MFDISYSNVMKGLNLGIHMSNICPSIQVTDYLFRRAIDLWHIEGFSKVFTRKKTIQYGDVQIRFRSITLMGHDSYQGFQGIFLFHPNLHPASNKEEQILRGMLRINDRYQEPWHN